MKKYIAAMLAPLLLMGSLAFGGDTLVVIDNKLVKVESVVDPKVSIVAPSGAVDLGEIVKLEAKLDGEVPTFLKAKKFKWTVTERGYVKQFWEQDNWVIFGTGVKATNIRVTCEVTLTYQLEKEEVLKKIETVVDLKVGEPAPGPDPAPNPDPKPPGPNPNPTPTPAPELTGVAKLARDWANEVGPSHKAKSAAVIAKALQGVAVRIGHDEALTIPRAVLVATKTEINSSLTAAGITPQDWDKWGAKLQEWAYNEYQAGRMQTVGEYKTVWGDIATGLNAVK